MFFRLLVVLFALFAMVSCKTETLQTVLDVANQTMSTVRVEPTQREIGLGLKEALSISIEKGAASLSKKNGFLGNKVVKILLPPEVKEVQSTLQKLGLKALTDQLTVKLNRAAEDAAMKSIPIFKEAILGMNFNDVMGILTGPDHAATDYLKGKTSEKIYKAFSPEIANSLSKVGAPKLWNEIFSRYNAIPFVKKVNTDLVDYTSQRALSGLFATVSQREELIRGQVGQRTTPLLQKVFGYADKLKK